MKFFINKYVTILLLILFFGCTNNNLLVKKPEKIPSLENLYSQAYKSFELGDWNKSISLFKKVETYYAYTEWAPRASYLIMYMYYEANEEIKTLEYAKKIKKLYPTSKNMDYVEYIIGLVFYDEINAISRDQKNSFLALKQFKKILTEYPNSIYADDVKFKIDLIYEQLAGKEIYLARYFMKKSKWIPAIQRLNNVIEKYDTTIYSMEALHRLVEIYYKLGNYDQANKYAAILGYNYNSSEWYKQSYKLLINKEYLPKDRTAKKKIHRKVLDFFKFSK